MVLSSPLKLQNEIFKAPENVKIELIKITNSMLIQHVEPFFHPFVKFGLFMFPYSSTDDWIMRVTVGILPRV